MDRAGRHRAAVPVGYGRATLAPSTLSLIRNMFVDPRERTVAISVWVTRFSVGGAVGPLVGGVMLAYFWWGSVFLIGQPVMVPLLLPEYRDPNPGRIDVLSALQSLAPGGTGAALLDAARSAFADAFQVAAACSAAIVAVTAAAAASVLRQPKVTLSAESVPAQKGQ